MARVFGRSAWGRRRNGVRRMRLVVREKESSAGKARVGSKNEKEGMGWCLDANLQLSKDRSVP